MFLLIVYFIFLLKFYVKNATGYSHATACSALRPVVPSSNGATAWRHYCVNLVTA